jgi:hypothetical protein
VSYLLIRLLAFPERSIFHSPMEATNETIYTCKVLL